MNKQDAINLLGGSPKKAAQAMGYVSVHAIYMWPDVLSVAVSDRVLGAAARKKTKRRSSGKIIEVIDKRTQLDCESIAKDWK